MSEPMHNPLLPAAYDVFWSVAVVAVLLLAVMALITIARTATPLPASQALLWTLIVICVPVLGPLAWLSIGRRSANRLRDM